jgi:acryloyl-coenzyme A reductase
MSKTYNAQRIVALNEPLQWQRVERVLELAPNQVEVQVEAAGVCYRDLLDRRGAYPFIRLPIATGHEFSGTICRLGSEAAKRWQLSDRVANVHGDDHSAASGLSSFFGLVESGAYAEYIVAPEHCLVRVPDGVSFRDAAAVMCTAAVALRGLRSRGQLKRGESVLVSGASGGVGVHALQVAKMLGAGKVIGVTTSADKVEFLRSAGADQVIVADASEPRFHKDVGDGVDVVLETVGAPTFNASLRSLKPGGRLVVIGNVTAASAKLSIGLAILKELAVLGSSGCSKRDLEDVFKWIESGKFRAVIMCEMPLRDAAKAQSILEEKRVLGRIVLRPRL